MASTQAVIEAHKMIEDPFYFPEQAVYIKRFKCMETRLGNAATDHIDVEMGFNFGPDVEDHTTGEFILGHIMDGKLVILDEETDLINMGVELDAMEKELRDE